jgi:hypothetical protein
MELPGECTILKSHQLLTFNGGNYSYKIERKGDQSFYTVSDSQQSLTFPIAYAFGLGDAGQTYVFESDGNFYESRVSYFRAIDALDWTLGALNHKAENILQAAGQVMTRDEKLRCFGCHSTSSVKGLNLTLDTLIAGVQCERCHGPTENHLAGIKQGNAQMAHMDDLKKLTSEETANFCGQCHRTWAEIAIASRPGIADVRFQPYRLTLSKCYDADDSRIRCTACHDPHLEIDQTAAHYDSKCLACHPGSKPAAKACPVSKENCSSCHMPALDLPGAHHKFTDHRIRVVKANEPYPD